MEDANLELQREQMQELREESRLHSADFDEDTKNESDSEEQDLFPYELDLEMTVKKCIDNRITIHAIAESISNGFAKYDPFKLEQLADELYDKSFRLQRVYKANKETK